MMGLNIWSNALQTTNSLIVRPLSGSPNCAWSWVAPVLDQGIQPTPTINVCRASEVVFSYAALLSRDLNLAQFRRRADALFVEQRSRMKKDLTKGLIGRKILQNKGHNGKKDLNYTYLSSETIGETNINSCIATLWLRHYKAIDSLETS